MLLSYRAVLLFNFAALACLMLAPGCSRDSSSEDPSSLDDIQVPDQRQSQPDRQLTGAGQTGAETSDGPYEDASVSDSAARAIDAAMGGGTAAAKGAPANHSAVNAPSADDGGAEIVSAPPAFELAPKESPEQDTNAPMALRSDLTAAELADLLEKSDVEMELIASGRARMPDPAEASARMIDVAKIKLDASLKLQKHPDATEQQRVEGMRGQLQALSHLTAMGDAASAKALQSLAEENLTASDPTIAGDSRIVLIGLAIDAFQAGKPEAADRIVSLVEGMTANPSADVPAVLVMAEARQMLATYGLVDQAAKIREKILSLYGNHSDPMIAQVAADAAGTTKFDVATRLLSAILENDQVALARWTDAVTELVDKAPEMNTVQFLASSALQLEAAGRDRFVTETFRILSERFNDPNSATATEVQTAKQAMEARQDVIGSPFDFGDLPTVAGQGVTPDDYEGQVILMPFWAISIPESLQLVQMLKDIREAHPDKVAIVGMNLDPEQAPLREFLAANDLGFKSYRSISSATESVANPIAAKFGLVSLPFVAIFDQQGRVAELDFTGRKLSTIVDDLLTDAK